MTMGTTAIQWNVLLLVLGLTSGCGFGNPEKPANKPAVLEHSHYRCSIVWTRDLKDKHYVFYDLNCLAKKAGRIKNVAVYTRKLNRKSHRKVTLDKNQFVESRDLAPKEEFVKTGRLKATVRSSYRLELVARGEWTWPDEIVKESGSRESTTCCRSGSRPYQVRLRLDHRGVLGGVPIMNVPPDKPLKPQGALPRRSRRTTMLPSSRLPYNSMCLSGRHWHNRDTP